MAPKSPPWNPGRRVLVTGGAGFIGSHLVEALVKEGAQVTVLDNLSSGKVEFLSTVASKIRLVRGDAGDRAVLAEALRGQDEVWHLAANPEVRTGATDPSGHYNQNVAATFTLLEAMRAAGVRRIRFTSTSTVYGRASVIPTAETYGPLYPISVYGACKLACEALLASYAGTFDFNVLLFRFANVVGPRSTHGVTFDFVRKLQANPNEMEILGDGTQTKSYVSVDDTVAGMLFANRHQGTASGICQALNIGSDDAIPVTEVAKVVAAEVGVHPKFRLATGASDGAGWTGDVKRMGLDSGALQALGWKPRHSSAEAIRTAAAWLVALEEPKPRVLRK